MHVRPSMLSVCRSFPVLTISRQSTVGMFALLEVPVAHAVFASFTVAPAASVTVCSKTARGDALFECVLVVAPAL